MPARKRESSARVADSTGVSIKATPSVSQNTEVLHEVLQQDLAHRVAALSTPARAVHQAVLRAFLTLGRAPTPAELRPAAKQVGGRLERLLAELVTHDVIQRATDGAIAVAYPFSSAPTPHQVQVEDAPPVFAMCALDALGIPFMVGRAATIHTQDPIAATPITVTIAPTSGDQTWLPETAVVLANAPSKEPIIKAVCSCPFVNAFASPATANRWRADHPERVVQLLTQAQALAEARRIFGSLLGAPPFAGSSVGMSGET